MVIRIASIVATVAVLLPVVVIADDETRSADDAAREARFASLTERIPKYVLVGEDANTPFELRSEPVLRWTNPVRETEEGGVFLWTDRGRVAAISCAFWRNETEYKHELQSLSDGPLVATLEGQRVWAPTEGGVSAMPVEKTAVAPTRALRLVQMRELARRYEARIGADGKGEPLRLLRQPLYRYDEKVAAPGIVDGALFAFVQTTDPEVLVRIEARTDESGATHWTVGFARMSRWNQTVLLDGETVWSVDWVPGSREATYNVLTYQLDKPPG